jgi:DNA-binding transcriptional LysR family regulator
LLPTALASFLSAHPNTDVELETRPSREIVRTIVEGCADVGIVTDAVDPAEELETFSLGAKLGLSLLGRV